MTPTRFEFQAIGVCRSPYTDKFGIPRQPRLVEAAEARILLLPPYDRAEAFSALEGFSHVWLVFVFHADCLEAGWRPTVRPPRLGARAKVGVFASRSPYRPNPIGLSAVPHQGLERTAEGLSLRVAGADLLDGTPILDIKPYVPYADAIAQAAGGFAGASPPARFEVHFSPAAEAAVARHDPDGRLRLGELIGQVIAQDPRPGYMDRYPQRARFGLRLHGLDVSWRIDGDRALVTAVAPAAEQASQEG
jgi:tRNA-Thr(GGU) m(6)t(6)A37 methyltransferase TsaA